MMMKVFAFALLATTVSAQDAAVFGADEVVCEGVKRTLYSTQLEVDEDPCDFSCSYDTASGAVQAQCRYDYCEACSGEDCGVRVVEIATTITQDQLDIFTSGQGPLEIGSRRKYCIDYTQGTHDSKMMCIVVDDSFENDCDDFPYGLPLLACNEQSGCECANSGEVPTDPASTYVGFGTLDFSSCYVDATVQGTNPDASSQVDTAGEADTVGEVDTSTETSTRDIASITDGTKSASASAGVFWALFSLVCISVMA